MEFYQVTRQNFNIELNYLELATKLNNCGHASIDCRVHISKL